MYDNNHHQKDEPNGKDSQLWDKKQRYIKLIREKMRIEQRIREIQTELESRRGRG